MPTTPPPLDFDHKPGFEIATKHKNAIRELHGFGGKTTEELMARYKLTKSTIHHVLDYEHPERARPTRTGRPKILTDTRVDEVIEYLSETWDNRCLDWTHLRDELKLPCSPDHLATRLKQRGYFCCIACQKPYLTPAQVLGRLLWAITHIFWHAEWLKVLWSDEVTFLVRGRTVKQRVTRKRGERTHPTCIQHQLHRGHITPVNAWGAIGYGYKSPLIFVHGSGKSGALMQKDYLAQVLAPHIESIVHAFAAVTHLLRPSAEPLFMEDGNSAHGHKSTRNCCA
jgi:hypothetical protein